MRLDKECKKCLLPYVEKIEEQDKKILELEEVIDKYQVEVYDLVMEKEE